MFGLLRKLRMLWKRKMASERSVQPLHRAYSESNDPASGGYGYLLDPGYLVDHDQSYDSDPWDEW